MNFAFTVDQIPTAGLDADGVLDRAWVDFALGDRATPIGDEFPMELRLKRKDKNVTADGGMALEYEFECSRCAEPGRIDLEVPVRIAFVYGEEESEEAIDPWGLGSDREAHFYKSNVIDLEDAVREQVVFAIPQYPLCTEECRGLCAQCGTNKNQTTCECSVQPTDSRWGALANIKLGG